MKKYVIAALCVLLAGVGAMPVRAEATASEEGKVYWGYCSPSITVNAYNGVGYELGKEWDVEAAIAVSEGMNRLLEGRKIYKLKVGVAALEAKGVTLFVRTAEGRTLWSKQTDLKWGWTEVVLDEPVVVPAGKGLLVGYDCHQGPDEYVVATDAYGSSSATAKKNGLLMTVQGDDLVSYSTLGNLCLLFETDGKPADFDCVASLLHAGAYCPYAPQGGTVDAILKFHNEGFRSISNVTLGCTFNGEPQPDIVTSFKRSAKACSEGDLNLKLTPAASGEYVFTLKEVEGQPVEVSPMAMSVGVYKADEALPRRVLLEEFTSQSCGNCPAGNTAMHDAFKGLEDRAVVVAHHAGYGDDIFSIEESDRYTYFYNSDRTFAPAMMMDRSLVTALCTNYSPVFNPNYLTAEIFQERMNEPAVVSVNVKAEYDEASRLLKVQASGHAIAPLVGERVGLHVFLLESGYEEYQANAKNYVHNDFVRAVLTGLTGDPIVLNDQNDWWKEYTYNVPETYASIDASHSVTTAHPEQMRVVAFVAPFDPVYTDYCQVLNANQTRSLNDEAGHVGISSAGADGGHVFVRGGRVFSEGSAVVAGVVDMQGASRRNEGLQRGVYVVKLRMADGQTSVRKVVVE